MSCKPCQEKALREQKARVASTMSQRNIQYKSGVATRPVNYASSVTSGCNRMRDALGILEKDIVRLYKIRGRYGNEEGYGLLRDQKTVRRWITNLVRECPPEEEYHEMRARITNGLNTYDK